LLGGLVYVMTSISSFTLSRTGKIETQQDMVLRYLVMSAVLGAVIWCAVRVRRRAAKLVIA